MILSSTPTPSAVPAGRTQCAIRRVGKAKVTDRTLAGAIAVLIKLWPTKKGKGLAMDKLFEKRSRLIGLFGHAFWLQTWVYWEPYSCNHYGKWPFCIWLYKWGIGFHWKTIADAHMRIART